MIKAVISDMDGTLLTYDGSYDPAVVPLIRTIQDKDILFSVATGKAYFGEVARIIKELNLSPLNVVNAGAMIINWQTGETPWLQTISAESLRFIVEYYAKLNLVFSVETKSKAYMLSVVKTPAYAESTPEQFTLSSLPENALKILVHAGMNHLAEVQVETYRKHILDHCKDVEVMKFKIKDAFGLDVTTEKSTKHTAVLEYARIHNIHPSELIGIGDSYNDYPLFTACGYRIAMGNAPKELLALADKVVSSTAQGGMREALEHVLTLIG